MELIERPNLKAVKYLKSIQYTTFKNDCIQESIKNGDEKPKEKDMKTWYELLQQFCKTNLKTKGVTKRIYSYSLGSPDGVCGRLFSGGSIQGIWGRYRGLVLRGISTDIDMVNCHPVILLYICKKHNIPCPNLEYYINHRDEILRKFPNRNIGKKLFLITTNTEKRLRGDHPEVLKKYDKEMKDIQKKLIEIPEYKNIVDSVPEEKRDANFNGSAINRILCYYENTILQHSIHVINNRGIEIAVLMFDGLMVYGNHYNDSSLLEEITLHVNSKMEGLNMKWSYKQLDDTLQIPDDFDESKVEDDTIGVLDDLDGAKMVYKLYPYWVTCKRILYVFDKTSGLWTDNRIDMKRIIGRFASSLYLLKPDKDGKLTKTSKSYGGDTRMQNNMIEQLITLDECRNDNWIKETQFTSLGKLLFNNGYYDFITEKFYKKDDEGFTNSEIVFTGKIYHDFEPFTDDEMEYMDDVQQRLFYNSLGENVGDYLILNLARGLAGDRMKRMLFGLGESGSGKTVITQAIMSSCGDYVGSFNAENLACRNSSNDEAQIMRWVLLLRNKRIIFSNEIKSTVEINGNFIKKISSGGDKIIGRRHRDDEEEFYTHFLPVCFANDLPKITPYDDGVDIRVRIISYNKSYVDEPSNEFELKKDPNIESEIKTLLFQRVMVGLLIREYSLYKQNGLKPEPDEVLNAKTEWVGEEANCIKSFLNDYEITNDANHYVKSNDVKFWLERKKFGISMEKFSKELKKYCSINHFENVFSKQKKIGGKNFQIWSGVNIIRETLYEEDMEL